MRARHALVVVVAFAVVCLVSVSLRLAANEHALGEEHHSLTSLRTTPTTGTRRKKTVIRRKVVGNATKGAGKAGFGFSGRGRSGHKKERKLTFEDAVSLMHTEFEAQFEQPSDMPMVADNTATGGDGLALPPATCAHFPPVDGMSRMDQPRELCAPSYVVIGFPKTGSTSLWNYCAQHPQIHVYYRKEAHFFHKPPKEVAHAIPWFEYLAKYQHLNASDVAQGVIVGDHTPGYVWRIPWDCTSGAEDIKKEILSRKYFGCSKKAFPITNTMMNIKRMVPRAKLVVLVRDPTQRTFSHFHHFYDPAKCKALNFTGKTRECFHLHAEYEVSLAQACMAEHGQGHPLCAWGPIGFEAWRQDIRGVSLGLYSVFLEEWLKVFPKRQFCVLDLEDFKGDVGDGMRKIEKCLGLDPHVHYEAVEINRRGTLRRVQPMKRNTRALLDGFFAPFNRRLCRLHLKPLDCNPGWLRKHQNADARALAPPLE